MLYTSTRGNGERVRSTKAVLNGLAKDGGLYMPVKFPEPIDYRELCTKSFREMAVRIFSCFLDDYPDIDSVVERAYRNKFDTEEITPTVKVGDRYVLELFHGPTSAFKDVALSALPVLMTEAQKLENETDEILILTATSGDTGKAAMEGFRDVPGIRIVVFYPNGGVSPVQEKQMTTQEGNNVRAAAVCGNFDDAQTGVKEIFSRVQKEGLPREAHTVLSSANSINIGRLVPQIVYYYKGYSDLVKAGVIKAGEEVDFTVPTGNFGDILAGYFAKKLGLPIRKLICASNENNVLTDFFDTGKYDKNRPFFKTSSPSMDILVSSNLERLLYLACSEDGEYVSSVMRSLKENGFYEIPEEMREEILKSFDAGFSDTVEAASAIKSVYEKTGYLMDPHTAVAYHVADNFIEEEESLGIPNIVLSTASPYKFPKDVLNALGIVAGNDPFEVMDQLNAATHVPVPDNLKGLRERPVRFRDVVLKEDLYDYVIKEVLHVS
ncbi:MAG: threonine synthase [Lachnospiraceae bacterium]|nr:threonine synthase [Lachnospiraceae bacterium]